MKKYLDEFTDFHVIPYTNSQSFICSEHCNWKGYGNVYKIIKFLKTETYTDPYKTSK